MDNHQIGMAQLLVTKAPGVIRSTGLGSCIGIILYDPFVKVGGMAHAMLPKHRPGRGDNKAKYVDTAIDTMLEDMEALGANRLNIIAKLAGGAQMFPDSDRDSLMVIGSKNIAAAEEHLSSLGIAVVARDVGGHSGRTLELDCRDGTLYIKTVSNETKI
ncbi:MAG: chemotaxis protein CheD [Eubacteriales bacterium]|nr:chemotaxis protein CheD [Eubacteriales bacterium]MDD3073565.1 chemotaxis protein CheD [Eubacteriales bacterium]MDD4079003.1 chemotaxis protein CheD [Eubacteriales bacterium]MDD4769184.1 chemotaxis protein CheD [Eubacteriales bacterium]